MKKELKTYYFEHIGTMNTLIWSPEEIEGDLPCILFLHGSGERGADPEILAMQGLPKYLTAGRELPAVVVCPQCPEDITWGNVLLQLEHILSDVLDSYPIDQSRVALTGISMGGFGSWNAACTWPEKFCRVAPICGGGMTWRAEALKDTPIWAFHGDADTAVEPEYSRLMVDAVNAAGGDAVLTMLPGVGHNSWDPAYLKFDLLSWLLGENTPRKTVQNG